MYRKRRNLSVNFNRTLSLLHLHWLNSFWFEPSPKIIWIAKKIRMSSRVSNCCCHDIVETLTKAYIFRERELRRRAASARIQLKVVTQISPISATIDCTCSMNVTMKQVLWIVRHHRLNHDLTTAETEVGAEYFFIRFCSNRSILLLPLADDPNYDWVYCDGRFIKLVSW